MEAFEKLEKAAFQKFAMPSFDLGIEFNMTQGATTSKVDQNAMMTETAADVEAVMTENGSDVEHVMTETAPDVEDVVIETAADLVNQSAATGEENEEVGVTGEGKTATDGELNKEVENKQENAELKPHTRKRKLRKLGNVGVNYRSPFLKNNRRLCKEMRRDEKIVLDYGMSKEVENDCAYQDEGGIFITREEFQTLQEENIDNSIIDAFVKILNDREKSNKTTKRTFIATTQVYAMFDFASGDPNENVIDRLEKELNEAGADKYHNI
ncbi:unnamed protein product [Cuscuta europaea]|uniref:Uncharacterized protein n=1 Tax=Cuscuta europaea TaxID=41803 RepID=A0A9P0YPK1_CUSEU|nr:unnamed protein product [Cuscuta europaea]